MVKKPSNSFISIKISRAIHSKIKKECEATGAVMYRLSGKLIEEAIAMRKAERERAK